MSFRIALVFGVAWLTAVTSFGGMGRAATEQELEQSLRLLIDRQIGAENGDVVVQVETGRNGRVTRLSVAVLVRDTVSPAALGDLSASIHEAAGIDAGRGDTLEVVALPFVSQREESDDGLLERLEAMAHQKFLDRVADDRQDHIAGEEAMARRLETLLEPVAGQAGAKVAVAALPATTEKRPRLSVAVLIDGTSRLDSVTGEQSYEPRSTTEMDGLAKLLRAAVGFDPGRGDILELLNLQFAETPRAVLARTHELRRRHETYLREKIADLLEPATGIGNVHVMVSVPHNLLGEIARITAVVYVSGRWEYDFDMKLKYAPLPPELKDLYGVIVRSAVGYDAGRHDVVEIVDLPSPLPE